jgi:tRNA pseudouridine38-40 synthase
MEIITKRYRLDIEYDGTNFAGWQRQKSAPSAQQLIEEVLVFLLKHQVNIYASGRTDAGVHAINQVAHFDTNTEFTGRALVKSLNHFLREHGICVKSVIQVENDFHARFSAVNREYIYKIVNRDYPSPLMRKRAMHVNKVLDICKMREGAVFLIGSHDFTSFRSASCQAKSPLRSINSIEIRRNNELIEISISAKSFLHNQVRIIVGCLIAVGIGKIAPTDVKRILEARDRTKAPFTAEAQGLYFIGPSY